MKIDWGEAFILGDPRLRIGGRASTLPPPYRILVLTSTWKNL